MKSVEIHLPYYKQGDDLGRHLRSCPIVVDALEAHAQELDEAARILREVKEMLSEQEATIIADTHMIHITAPDHVADALLKSTYASIEECDDDE